MWLGEQITERGLGNGISIIIFCGHRGRVAACRRRTLELARTGAFSIPLADHRRRGPDPGDGFVVFVERGQRKIL